MTCSTGSRGDTGRLSHPTVRTAPSRHLSHGPRNPGNPRHATGGEEVARRQRRDAPETASGFASGFGLRAQRFIQGRAGKTNQKHAGPAARRPWDLTRTRRPERNAAPGVILIIPHDNRSHDPSNAAMVRPRRGEPGQPTTPAEAHLFRRGRSNFSVMTVVGVGRQARPERARGRAGFPVTLPAGRSSPASNDSSSLIKTPRTAPSESFTDSPTNPDNPLFILEA